MDSPMAIRRLTHLEPETLSMLVVYGRSALGDSAIDEWMLPVIASCGLLYVGRVGEETVGAAEILGILDSGDIYLEGFYIRPEMQGRGHGTELMLGVIDLLAREGFNRMLVTLAPENEAGTRLYDKTGFREIDYLPDHYGAGRHRLLLAVELRGQKDQ